MIVMHILGSSFCLYYNVTTCVLKSYLLAIKNSIREVFFKQIL